MREIIESEDRGQADLGWLQSRHTFSFATYNNPERVSYGPLRVINEDWVAAGKGFDTHPHRDMEIITYMLEGELEHKDSMGNGSVIRPGELQRMTAGTGVLHSEFNPSDEQRAHLLQIWIFPEQKDLEPSYEQKTIPEDAKRNRWCLVGSREGREGSLTIHQDVDLFASVLEENQTLEIALRPSRRGFLHVARGKVKIGEEELSAGDALTTQDESPLNATALEQSELLLFDMA